MRKYFNKIYTMIDYRLFPLKMFLLAWTEPACWIINKKAKSILDIGCGMGTPMLLIKMRMKPQKTVGVDLYKPYLQIAKAHNSHDEYVCVDIRKIPFSDRSFDVVIALQVLEHLPKEDSWEVLKKIEKIAKKQIIIATPIGEMRHPLYDANRLMEHKSVFYPDEFTKRGYTVYRWGRKDINDDCSGILYKITNSFLRRSIHMLFLLCSPIFLICQPCVDFYLYAYKNINEKENS